MHCITIKLIKSYLEIHVLEEVCNTIVGCGLVAASCADVDTNSGSLTMSRLGHNTESVVEGGNLCGCDTSEEGRELVFRGSHGVLLRCQHVIVRGDTSLLLLLLASLQEVPGDHVSSSVHHDGEYCYCCCCIVVVVVLFVERIL